MVRRGKKRALIAVGHKILCCAYNILKKKEEYKDFDPTNNDKNKKEYIRNYHLLRLRKLGYTVEIKENVA